MTPIEAAYDNIRLLRRKVRIAQEAAAHETSQIARDEAVMRLADVTDDLLRALQDFADLGFEEHVAKMVSAADRPALVPVELTVSARKFN